MFIVIVDIFMLTGCWNYVELNGHINVSGIAIDMGRQGKKYHLSAEVVTVGVKENSEVSANVIETDADTVFEGIRNMMTLSTKKLYFGHCKALVICEKMAKSGLAETLDMLIRNHEMRTEMDIVVAKGCDAKDILLTEGIANPIMAYKIYDLLKTSPQAVGGAPITKAYKIFNSIQNEGVCTVIPTLEVKKVEDKKVLKLTGVAVFDNDRLVGYLDELETKHLSFLNGKIKNSGLLTVKDPENPDLYLSYEIYKSKTERKLQFNKDLPSVNITINTSVIIGEVEIEADFTRREEIERVRAILEKSMNEELSKMINMAQEKLECDILGIGAQMQRDNPKMWEKYKDDWDKTFKKLEIKVDCKIKITGSGIESGTAKKEPLR